LYSTGVDNKTLSGLKQNLDQAGLQYLWQFYDEQGHRRSWVLDVKIAKYSWFYNTLNWLEDTPGRLKPSFVQKRAHFVPHDWI
jgi:hypothetical protein